jgi:hypothetical protein
MDNYEIARQTRQAHKAGKTLQSLNLTNNVQTNMDNELVIYFDSNPLPIVVELLGKQGFKYEQEGRGGRFVVQLYKRSFTGHTIASYIRIISLPLLFIAIILAILYIRYDVLLIGCFINNKFGCRI